MTADWGYMENASMGFDSSSDLFGGVLFGDELMDLYNPDGNGRPNGASDTNQSIPNFVPKSEDKSSNHTPSVKIESDGNKSGGDLGAFAPSSSCSELDSLMPKNEGTSTSSSSNKSITAVKVEPQEDPPTVVTPVSTTELATHSNKKNNNNNNNNNNSKKRSSSSSNTATSGESPTQKMKLGETTTSTSTSSTSGGGVVVAVATALSSQAPIAPLPAAPSPPPMQQQQQQQQPTLSPPTTTQVVVAAAPGPAAIAPSPRVGAVVDTNSSRSIIKSNTVVPPVNTVTATAAPVPAYAPAPPPPPSMMARPNNSNTTAVLLAKPTPPHNKNLGIANTNLPPRVPQNQALVVVAPPAPVPPHSRIPMGVPQVAPTNIMVSHVPPPPTNLHPVAPLKQNAPKNNSTNTNTSNSNSNNSQQRKKAPEEQFKGVAQAAVSNLILSATGGNNNNNTNNNNNNSNNSNSAQGGGKANKNNPIIAGGADPMKKAVDTSSAHIAALTSSNWVAACTASIGGEDNEPGSLEAEQAAALAAASDPAAAKAARARRANLTPDERARQNRDRNREHARNTRLRKKAYVEELKKTLTELVAQRDASDLEKRHEAQRDLEVREVRFRVMEEFLKLRACGGDANLLARWVAILDDGFTLTIPNTPYRHMVSTTTGNKMFRTVSSENTNVMVPPLHNTMNHTQILKGATESMADAAKISSFFNSLSNNRGNNTGTAVNCTYHCDRKHFMMDNITACLDWTLATNGLINQGLGAEIHIKGTMRAKFCPASNKLASAELLFDTGSVMAQTKRCTTTYLSPASMTQYVPTPSPLSLQPPTNSAPVVAPQVVKEVLTYEQQQQQQQQQAQQHHHHHHPQQQQQPPQQQQQQQQQQPQPQPLTNYNYSSTISVSSTDGNESSIDGNV